MKIFHLILTILCVIATIVFIVRKDIGALYFGIFGVISNFICFMMEVYDEQH